MHFLGRDYLYKGRWDDCIGMLKRHLEMPTAVWRDERCASMRYIAKSYARKGEVALARDWFLRAIAEAPWLREPYIELALLLYEQKEWAGVLYLTRSALAITERPATYICEASSWGSLPYDLQAVAYFHTGQKEEALQAARAALELEPGNKRLQRNVELLAGKQ